MPIVNYSEKMVAVMAMTNILTSLEILTGLECVTASAYLYANIKIVEHGIGAIADSLNEPEDGAIGSEIINMAMALVKSSENISSSNDAIYQTAKDAIERLSSILFVQEYDAEKRLRDSNPGKR